MNGKKRETYSLSLRGAWLHSSFVEVGQWLLFESHKQFSGAYLHINQDNSVSV